MASGMACLSVICFFFACSMAFHSSDSGQHVLLEKQAGSAAYSGAGTTDLCGTTQEGQGAVTFTAPTGNVFTSVVFASYGTPTGTCGKFVKNITCGIDVTAFVTKQCIGQSTCQLTADNGLYTDPCYGTVKHITAELAYGLPVPVTTDICGTTREAYLGGGPATLTAPTGNVFTSVIFASYGTPLGTCGRYFKNSVCNIDATAYVTKLCIGLSTCTLVADNAIFTDPCVGTIKNLTAELAWGPAPTTPAPTTPAPVPPPVKTGGITILSSTYGLNCASSYGVKKNNDQLIVKQCTGLNTCTYVINYLVIGDPAVGCPKDYDVSYSCDNGVTSKTLHVAGESGFSSSITLSCPAPSTSGLWNLTTGALWSSPIQCPNTKASGWCILPHNLAIELCSTIPNCYWSVTTNAGWNSAYPNSAQLGYGPLISNSEWQSYGQPGPWVHITGQLWSKPIVCPGTQAAGYCVLPVSQAIALCTTISGCYWSITTNSGWNGAYPKSAQLGYGPLIANAEWVSYGPNAVPYPGA